MTIGKFEGAKMTPIQAAQHWTNEAFPQTPRRTVAFVEGAWEGTSYTGVFALVGGINTYRMTSQEGIWTIEREER